MTGPSLHLVVPGSIDQRTGGYIYDARMAEGLRRRGWTVTVHELDGAFPDGDAHARASLAATLDALPDGARVMLDGLALAVSPPAVRASARRLRVLAIVHHPLADETGLPPATCSDLGAREQEALGACAGVVVTSRFTSQRLETLGVPAAHVRVVRPGTDPAPFASEPASGAPVRILCVGSVIPRKGQDVLVEALVRLRALDWTCVCAGSLTRAPAYAEAVRAAVHDARLHDRIGFPGECAAERLQALYTTSSLFVLPSHYEGYGMVLSEAVAHGLPIVSTTGGAIPEAVPEGAAILVPPGDADALAAALEPLLAGSSSAGPVRTPHGPLNALAAVARRRAVNLPRWDHAAAAFADAVLGLSRSG